MVARRTARVKPVPIPLKGAGFYERPVWSPDSKKIAFIDNARTLYWIDLAYRRVRSGSPPSPSTARSIR